MVEVLVSTTGPSALTVTVSVTAPTGRVKSRVTAAAEVTSMFSRWMFLNPDIEAPTVYLPGGRLSNTYVPLAEVVPDLRPPINAGLEISTVAPGKPAPSTLAPVPLTFPSCLAWARHVPPQPPQRRR